MKKLAILLIFVLLLTGCAQKTVTEKTKVKPTAEEKVIKVGVIGPMNTVFGIAEKKAVELAAKVINEEGGILGRKVVVISADTGMDQNKAATALRHLIQDEGCKVIIGGFASGVTIAVQPIIAETKTVWLADGAAPSLTDCVVKDYKHYKYFFRAGTLNGTTFAYDIFDVLNNYFNGELKKNWTRVAIIRDGAKWDSGVMKVLKPMLEKHGYKIVMDKAMSKESEDFTSVLLEAKEKHADVIITLLAHVSGIPLVKQWADMRIKIPIIGHDLSAISPTAWNSSDGKIDGEVFIATGGAIPVPLNDRAKWFLKLWKEEYGGYPDANTAYDMFDALFMYKWAVEQAEKAGEKDPFNSDVVVKYLERINASNPFETVRGNFAFTKRHDPLWGDKYIRNWVCQWQNGKIVIIWPKNVATGEYRPPAWMS